MRLPALERGRSHQKEQITKVFGSARSDFKHMKEFMRIEHNKLLRLVAVFLMSLTALITAKTGRRRN
jgi:hypothetical protein